MSRSKIGDVQVARGDLVGAEASYRADLEIAERLAALEPGNEEWQRDLSVSCYRMAFLHQGSGDQVEAGRWFSRCRDVLRGMAARGMHLDPQAASVLQQLEGMEGLGE